MYVIKTWHSYKENLRHSNKNGEIWMESKANGRENGEKMATFNVMVPTKPALTVTGSLREFSASAFNFKSLRTTSPAHNCIL